MSTDSIFNDTNSGTTIPPQGTEGNGAAANTDAELTNLLSGIKNERGEPKYKTLKDAIVGLQNAQEYIPDLKQTLADKDTEIARLRAEVERGAAIEETVRKLTEQREDKGTQPKSLSEQEIADLVKRSLDNTLTQREVIALQKQNIQSVVSSLQASFGADAEKKFNDKAVELGMSVAEFNALAAKSPKMVLGVLGVTGQSTKAFSPTSGSVNSEGFKPPVDSFVGRNKESTLIGATSQDMRNESLKANQMVAELHKQGRSVHELTDPKLYFKHFG